MKESFPQLLLLPLCLLALLNGGCHPDGPQLLLEGDRLLRDGKTDLALARLQEAIQVLPKNARAWNHLGLAQHQSRQSADAVRSYQRALQLDPAFTEARYNLGCLFLEMNKPREAAQELASYTLFHRDSIDGWLKLGYAQIRAGQADGALKSFTHAYQLNARHPAVLNGLGMLQVQQRKTREASAYFTAALREKPDYAPALLNLAVLAQQGTANQTAALKLYHDYLALQPRPANWVAVEEVARRLDADLHPPQTNHVAKTPVPATVTNLVSTTTKTPPPVIGERADPTPKSAPVEPPKTPPTIVAAPAVPISAPPPVEKPVMVVKATLPPAPVDPPAPVTTTKPRPLSAVVVVKPPALPVTDVTPPTRPEPVQPTPPVTLARTEPQTIRPPVPEPPPTRPSTVTTPEPPAAPVDETKPGFWNRVNPLNLFRSHTKPATPLPGDAAKKAKPVAPAPRPAPVATPAVTQTKPVIPPKPPVEPRPQPKPERPPIVRYRHISPPAPPSGDRKLALDHFTRAALAQRAGHFDTAMTEYREATLSDPAFYEAHFNLAIVALQADDLKRALSASEFALTLKPDSAEARNNFALALQRANYPLDAALELRKVLTLDPDNVQAHFALAGLYARQLNDNDSAREHYRKVLELNPRHPQAEAIRYWLAAQQ